ncbi:hypothetical protein ACFRJ7_24820 [Streptomyces sp. NPDC056747]|uniref:hypothetical protein n=1 Tax=Streptomyces sp. NPDC056747 TaxID=3345935 RepID=UPI00368F1D45
MATGRLHIIEVTHRRDGTWSYVDLNRRLDEASGADGTIPSVARDSGLVATGSGAKGQRLCYVDIYGSVVELINDGTWTGFRRLVTEDGIPAAGSGQLAATSAAGPVAAGPVVYYLDAEYHVVRLEWSDEDPGRWTHRTASDAPAGSPASALAALATGTHHCAYYVSGWHIIEVSWDAELTQGRTDLTSWVKGADEPNTAPYALSSLAAEGYGSDGRRVFYPSQTGDLIALVLDDGTRRWEALDLTTESGASVTATPTPLASLSVVGDDGFENTRSRVFSLNESHELSAMSREENGWLPKVVTGAPPASPLSALSCAGDPYGDLEYTPFIDGFGHMVTLLRRENGWDWVDLSGELDLPEPVARSPLSAVVTESGAHLSYLTRETVPDGWSDR